MSDVEIYEIEMDDAETDEMEDGSFLATAAVVGVGALLGFAAAKGYDLAKTRVQNYLAVRRANKIVELNVVTEEPAEEAE